MTSNAFRLKQCFEMQRRTRGFSLIELMVAMVIALIVLAGVLSSFLASKQAYLYNQEVAFIQENARYAAAYLSADIREAGNFGCSNDSSASSPKRNNYYPNNLVSALNPTTGARYKLQGVQGFDGHSSGPTLPTDFPRPAASPVLSGTDAILVRRADIDNALTVKSHTGSTFTLNTQQSAADGNAAGTIMVYASANCQYQTIFQETLPAALPSDQLGHAVGTSPAPGNKTTTLHGQLLAGSTYYSGLCTASSCPWEAATPLPTGPLPGAPDSKIMPLLNTLYYVAPSSIDSNVNALWMIALNKKGGGVAAAQELVLGVEDMRVYYGVDTDFAADGQANTYVSADQITRDTPLTTSTTSGSAFLAWSRVASVRVQLLMRSRNKVTDSTAQQTLHFDTGADFNKGGGYVWQIVPITVQLRNAYRG